VDGVKLTRTNHGSTRNTNMTETLFSTPAAEVRPAESDREVVAHIRRAEATAGWPSAR
jgi:hypothetical protein